MQLQRVGIRGFRNLREVSLEPSASLTLLVGQNGHGKTNILEAVHVLLQGQSFRTRRDRDYLADPGPPAPVVLTAAGRLGQRDITWSYMYDGQTRRRRQGPIVPVVVFSPDDLELARGAPSARRHLLDHLLSGVDRRYARSLEAFQRAVLQRNRALKEGGLRDLADDFLPAIVREGEYVWSRRYEVFDQLLPSCQTIYHAVAGSEAVSASYVTGGNPTRIESPMRYREALAARRGDEKVRQMTLVGPHRDDIQFTVNGRSIVTAGSQGQQRTLALAIKLATYLWLKAETGTVPLVMLDDVLSELDGIRRAAVLRQVAADEAQTIVTDTEPRDFGVLNPAVFEVAEGELRLWRGNPRPLNSGPF
ncbi:MAG: DNA replication and repair protein RecF [Thermaerobacter sp.]|nr:DNA replication and repair protein RecF [Thermaerobacter sp.]